MRSWFLFTSAKSDDFKTTYFYHFKNQENLGFFNADAESEIWQNYIGYIDDMIVEGFFNCIYCSLNYFAENMEVTNRLLGDSRCLLSQSPKSQRF